MVIIQENPGDFSSGSFRIRIANYRIQNEIAQLNKPNTAISARWIAKNVGVCLRARHRLHYSLHW